MVTITEKIFDLIKDFNYELIEHTPAQSCEESARLRGSHISIGGKSILFKDKSDFRLFTLPANKEVNNKSVRKILKSQKLRFATQQELIQLAGVEKGALPPFGRPLYPFDHYIDRTLLENEFIAFNAGKLTTSVILKMKDYLSIVNPIIDDFAL